MATYQVKPPESFNFARPEEWPKWYRRYERFSTASGLDDKDGKSRVNMLIYSMGDEAEDIFRSFSLSAEQQEVYDTVRERFDQHFIKRRNVIYERAKFNRRRQEQGESVDTFITSLYSLAEHCGYGLLHDEMIRDRIVVGILDSRLSEKLQLDADLTLGRAITEARQAETIKQQQPFVRDDPNKIRSVKSKPTYTERLSGKPQEEVTAKKCHRCGRKPHVQESCPALTAVCRKCHKRGHFQVMCRTNPSSGKVQLVREGSPDQLFLGTVTGDSESDWEIELQLNDTTIRFLIDTGAEVTLVSERVHSQLGSPKLRKSDRNLRGPNNNNIKAEGYFKGMLSNGNQSTNQEIYVV
jgi:hypothetical protein